MSEKENPRTPGEKNAIGEERFVALLDSVYEGILIADVNGNIVTANAQAEVMFELKREELASRNISDLVNGLTQDVIESLTARLEENKHLLIEAVALRQDGTDFCAEIALHRMVWGDDRPLCFSVRDVTSRTQIEARLDEAQRELVQAEKIKARLETITTVAQKVNNPLQILLNMVAADNNVRYAGPVNRIAVAIQEMELQEEIRRMKAMPDRSRYEISPPGLAWCNTHRVLVVDDEVTLLEFFKEILKDRLPGVEVDGVHGGAEALESFRVKHHAIIVLDVSMPEMSGDEVFEHIKGICEEKKWEMPVVVFCTGFSPPRAVLNAAETGRHCVLSKPVDNETLVSAVRMRLEIHELCHGAQAAKA